MLFFELIYKPVYNSGIYISTTKVCITIRNFNLNNSISTFKYRYIKCSTTKVIYKDFHIRFFIQSVSKSSCCRFVDYSFYFKSSNFTCVFCSLSLSFIKVGWNCNYCFCNFFTKVAFCSFFQLFEYLSSYLFWSYQFSSIGNIKYSITFVIGNNFVRNMFYLFLNFLKLSSYKSFGLIYCIFWV